MARLILRNGDIKVVAFSSLRLILIRIGLMLEIIEFRCIYFALNGYKYTVNSPPPLHHPSPRDRIPPLLNCTLHFQRKNIDFSPNQRCTLIILILQLKCRCYSVSIIDINHVVFFLLQVWLEVAKA